MPEKLMGRSNSRAFLLCLSKTEPLTFYRQIYVIGSQAGPYQFKAYWGSTEMDAIQFERDDFCLLSKLG